MKKGMTLRQRIDANSDNIIRVEKKWGKQLNAIEHEHASLKIFWDKEVGIINNKYKQDAEKLKALEDSLVTLQKLILGHDDLNIVTPKILAKAVDEWKIFQEMTSKDIINLRANEEVILNNLLDIHAELIKVKSMFKKQKKTKTI